MPPKKKNTDKNADKASANAPPGSAPDQNETENPEDDQVNHEQLIEDFSNGPQIALECMDDILSLAMQRIGDNHTERYTDQFTATAACEALVDLTDWLYLTCEEDAKLSDFQELWQPQQLAIDSWAESAGQREQVKFGHDKKDEVVGMYGSQHGLMDHVVSTHVGLLPEWLKKDPRPASSIAPTSMYSATHIQVKQKRKPNASIASRAKNQLSKQASKASIKQEKSNASIRPEPSVSKPATADPGIKKMSPGRIRQFRRRSEQHKAQKQNGGMKPRAPNNRLEPISGHHSQNLPSVQIIDPNAEALDARRKALKIGKVRPQTKSDFNIVRGKANASSTKKKMPQKPSAKLQAINSQRVLAPLGLNAEAPLPQHVSALPETLVDSLAVSDGSLAASMLEQTVGDDFERLKPVSIPTV